MEIPSISITQMPELVIAATQHGLIMPEQALMIAAAMDDMANRGVVYARVLALDVLDDTQADFAREQALAMAMELHGDSKQHRAGIIESIAPYLREADFAEAMSLILEIDRSAFRDRALKALVPCLDEEWCRQLFRAAMSYPHSQYKWQFSREDRLISIMPYVLSSEQMRIFEYTLQLPPSHHAHDSNLRAKLFIALAPHADKHLRQRIYEHWYAASDDSYEQPLMTLKLLAGLLQQAEDSEKDHYISELMHNLVNIPEDPDAFPRITWLQSEQTIDDANKEKTAGYIQQLAHDFAPHLTKMQLDAIVHMLLKLSASRSRCFALVKLLPYVDVGLRRLVIEEGLSMIPQLHGNYDMDADDEVRAFALTPFAAYVTDNLRVRYLRIARSLDSRERSHPLRELAIHTDDETEKYALLEEAWDAAVNLPFAAGISHMMNDQTEILQLIPHLNADLYDRTIEYALHSSTLAGYSAAWIEEQDAPDYVRQGRQQATIRMRSVLLEALAPHLNPDQLQLILAATDIEKL